MRSSFSILNRQLDRLVKDDLSLIEGKRIYIKKDVETGSPLSIQSKIGTKAMVKTYLALSYFCNQKGIAHLNINELSLFIGMDKRVIKEALYELDFYDFIYSSSVSKCGNFHCLIKGYENKMDNGYVKMTDECLKKLLNMKSIFLIRCFLQSFTYFERKKGYIRKSIKESNPLITAKEIHEKAKKVISGFKTSFISVLKRETKEKVINEVKSLNLIEIENGLIFPSLENDVDVIYEQEEKELRTNLLEKAKRQELNIEPITFEKIVNLSKQFKASRILEEFEKLKKDVEEKYLVQHLQILLSIR